MTRRTDWDVPGAVAVLILVAVLLPIKLGHPVIALIGTTVVVAVGVRQLIRLFDNRAELERLVAAHRDQALHDPLTGLANRALFADRLQHGLALHQRDLRPVSVLYCDLDGLKTVNDTYGHSVGDDVITEAARRLQHATRASDTVARLGGDEFAILLEPGADPATVALHILDAFVEPVPVTGARIAVTVSVGIAELTSSDPAISADELLHRADMAMYQAKRRRDGVAVFWPELVALPAA